MYNPHVELPAIEIIKGITIGVSFIRQAVLDIWQQASSKLG